MQKTPKSRQEESMAPSALKFSIFTASFPGYFLHVFPIFVSSSLPLPDLEELKKGY